MSDESIGTPAARGDGATPVIVVLRGLRQIREFRPDPVPEYVLRDILEVARWTGSAVNRQPWEFVVVRDRETLRALAGMGSGGHLASAPLAVVVVMAGARREGETYDEGRVTERMMLAAAAHGVGAGIGWLSQADGARAVKELLGVPAECTVRTAIAFGYADEAVRAARPRRPGARKPLDRLVHSERYGQRGT